jgi:hypothetical protein
MPSPFLYPPPAITQPIIIKDDGGGSVAEYMEKANLYNMMGRRVEIRGSCRSACTMALTVKNVCVGPGAIVKWHDAYNELTGQRRPDVTARMIAPLPEKIRNRIEGRVTEDYNPYTIISYRNLVKLGIPDCDDGVVKASDAPKPSKPVKVTYRMATPIDGLLNLFPFLKRK